MVTVFACLSLICGYMAFASGESEFVPMARLLFVACLLGLLAGLLQHAKHE
jgi:hypothetical protein